MRRALVIAVTLCVAFLAPRPAAAAPGDLDPDFGEGGIVDGVSGTEVVLQDGKIVVGGTGFVIGAKAWMQAVRLLPNGVPDQSFGTDGRASAAFAGSAYGEDVAVRPAGKVVVVGTRIWDGNAIAVARFRADGTLDATFGGDGKVTTSFSGSPQGRAVALQPDGRVVVAGTDGENFILVRYLRTGALDPTFGVRGRVTTVLPGDVQTAMAEDLAIDADGRIVVVGWLSWRTIVVARYLPNGTLDPAFGRGDGLKFTGGTRKCGIAVALQPDGKIVVGGYEEAWNKETQELDSFAIAARYTSDGRPDTAFGVVRIAPGGATDIGLQSDGKIVAVGGGVLARLQPDGSPDPSFGGGDGIVVTPGTGLGIQPDGRLVVVGFDVLARFLA